VGNLTFLIQNRRFRSKNTVFLKFRPLFLTKTAIWPHFPASKFQFRTQTHQIGPFSGKKVQIPPKYAIFLKLRQSGPLLDHLGGKKTLFFHEKNNPNLTVNGLSSLFSGVFFCQKRVTLIAPVFGPKNPEFPRAVKICKIRKIGFFYLRKSGILGNRGNRPFWPFSDP